MEFRHAVTTMNRREFVLTGAAASVAAAAAGADARAGAGRRDAAASAPVVISSANGHSYKNGGAQDRASRRAFAMMTEGKDVLDALIAGVNIVELDPEDTSVGYGGLPNAEGVVQLDACVHARADASAPAPWPASKACARRRWSRRR